MSTVIWALSPHPPLLIPEVGGAALDRVRQTKEALEDLCRDVAARRPDRLVLITPHGPVAPEAVPMLVAPKVRGSLSRFGHPEVALEVDVDLDLSEEIAAAAEERGVPIMRLRHVELDHALLVPLYYLRQAGVHVPVALLSISRLPDEDHRLLGEALGAVMSASAHRVAVVASGDLSHRLLDSGPYGFDEMGPVFDQKLLACLQAGDADAVLDLPDELVERAGQCGLRPILMLLGSLESGARSLVRSYEGPFGVGYAVAQFDPAGLPELPEQRIEVARQAVEEFVLHGRRLEIEPPTSSDLQSRAAVFVTLKLDGDLRGCIGTLSPTCDNQMQEIVQNAIAACSRDPRFPPVRAEELPRLQYQVYVLGDAEPVAGYDDLDPHRFGVIVRKGSRSGVLLPGIEGVNEARDQVAIACRKAGIHPQEGPELERFPVQTFR